MTQILHTNPLNAVGHISHSSRYCILPTEILDSTFQHLPQPDLTRVSLASASFNAICRRILYRSISISLSIRPAQSISCLKSLCHNLSHAPLVHSLEVRWPAEHPTANFYRLLHNTLRNLKNLTSLTLELSKPYSPAWIVEGCTFTLKQFTTSMSCDVSLAHFLDSQPSITDLTLRGHPPDSPSFFPAVVPSTCDFTLKPTSLPNLIYFRAIHADPSILASVIKGRPLHGVSLPLFAEKALASLDALALSSRPIRRLTVMSFDTSNPDYLLPQIARRVPDLEALHIIILMAQFTAPLLEASGPMLSEFKSLKYLTFMTATGEPESYSLTEEQRIATFWHKSCPTLKTIILPRGKVWFEQEERWACLDD